MARAPSGLKYRGPREAGTPRPPVTKPKVKPKAKPKVDPIVMEHVRKRGKIK